MMRQALIAIAALLFLALPALAQSGKKQASTGPDPDMLEINALLYAPNGGFKASGEILMNSFALRRHWEGGETPEGLSNLFAYYNAEFYFRPSVGGLYFHLAHAMHLLRDLDTPAARYRLAVLETRLQWAAGQHDRALDTSRAYFAESTLSDAQMTSLLTDAAILEHFLGDPETGTALLARARACKPDRCPQDLIFSWMYPDRKPAKQVPTIFDIDLARELARDGAAVLFAGDDTVLADIDREYDLMKGRGLSHVDAALTLAALDTDKMTKEQRLHLRNMSDRVMMASGYVQFIMGYTSVGQTLLRNVKDGKDAGDDIASIDYLQEGDTTIIRNMPLIFEPLRHAENPFDQYVADVFLARLYFTLGDPDRALQTLRSVIATARADGIADATLFTVHADIWAMADQTGNDTLAAEAWTALSPCLTTQWDGDLMQAYFDAIEHLPATPARNEIIELYIAAADRFVRREFPGDLLALADVYSSGSSQRYPMDAARRAETSFGFAEQVTDIPLADLSARARSAMDTLIYAGRYNDAFAIGERVAARFDAAGADETQHHRWFHQTWARAAHRIDHPRTRSIYEIAVQRGKSSDLHLDLLDTAFLDLLDQYLATRPHLSDTIARLRARQGRPAEAAETLRARRREMATQASSFDVLLVLYAEQAALHLRTGGLDAHVAALAKVDAVAAGNAPVDHPALYAGGSHLADVAFQEAHYWDLAGNPTEAARLRLLSGTDAPYAAAWDPLPSRPEADAIAAFQARDFKSWDTYDYIRHIIEIRDAGNYEVAAAKMRRYRWLAMAAEDSRQYVDAQTLWQMAFTFARAGQADIAFDLMNRAARIAANLSYEGAGGANGGTLQLLERDRWRYLLFIDIAWAAASGQAPEEMTVVSRY